jgi:hypothetical protein
MSKMRSMHICSDCHALNEASALADRGLNIFETSRVLVTIVLAGVHGLVCSKVRHILHLGVILQRGLGADNNLGVRHCSKYVSALTRHVMRRVIAWDESDFARLNGLLYSCTDTEERYSQSAASV